MYILVLYHILHLKSCHSTYGIVERVASVATHSQLLLIISMFVRLCTAQDTIFLHISRLSDVVWRRLRCVFAWLNKAPFVVLCYVALLEKTTDSLKSHVYTFTCVNEDLLSLRCLLIFNTSSDHYTTNRPMATEYMFWEVIR